MKKYLLFLLIMSILAMSSCTTSQYGCKGGASWNKVVKKANRLY